MPVSRCGDSGTPTAVPVGAGGSAPEWALWPGSVCLAVWFAWFRLSESETMTVLLHHVDTVLDTHASLVSRCSHMEKEAEIQDD